MSHQKVLDERFSAIGFKGSITESFDSRKDEIIELLNQHKISPPFTIQRIAEVLMNPTQFAATHKLMNSISKLLAITPLQ